MRQGGLAARTHKMREFFMPPLFYYKHSAGPGAAFTRYRLYRSLSDSPGFKLRVEVTPWELPSSFV